MRTTESDRRMLRGTRKQLATSEVGATHPALPAVILLVSFAVFMAAIVPLDFSTLFHKMFPPTVQRVPHKDAAVWVDSTAGVYYCANSILFGKTQGAYMKQVDALDRGYQPALGTYCAGPAWSLRDERVEPGKPTAAQVPAPVTVPPPATTPAAPPSAFENPNYKPQTQGLPDAGAGSTLPFPH